MTLRLFHSFIICLLLFSINPLIKAQSESPENCKDYPGFTRKQGYRFKVCSIKENDTVNFPVGNSMEEASRRQAVTGKSFIYFYTLDKDAPQRFSLLIFRDFEDSLRKSGGYVFARLVDASYIDSYITGKIERENMTAWINIRVYGSDYLIVIVEKSRKLNLITADSMWRALEARDTVTADVFFKDDTTIIIPESYPVIDQIVKMLNDHPDLKIRLEAHVDATMPPVNAKVLTAMRSKVVLDELVAKGIPKARLTSLGWGFDKPIGDNRTEEGRSLNRRLEIVRTNR